MLRRQTRPDSPITIIRPSGTFFPKKARATDYQKKRGAYRASLIF